MGRKLIVWERGDLHPHSTDTTSTVEWASSEYDAVEQDVKGDLIISKQIFYDTPGGTMYRWLTVGHIKAGLWLKYNLEEEEDLKPDAGFIDKMNDALGWVDSPPPAPEDLVGSFARSDDQTADDKPWDTALEQSREASRKAWDEALEQSRANVTAASGQPVDLNQVGIGSFARSDDPFADAAPVEPPTVVRAEPGAHAAPDDQDHTPGDPIVQPYDPERSTAITPDMRAKVLERLGEHVQTIGKKDEEAATSPSSTSLLGLQDTTLLPTVGDREVFSD